MSQKKETRTMQFNIKVRNMNPVVSRAAHWLSNFIDNEPRFFGAFVVATESVVRESKNPNEHRASKLMWGIIEKMTTGQEMTPEEVLTVCFFLQDSFSAHGHDVSEIAEELLSVIRTPEDRNTKVEPAKDGAVRSPFWGCDGKGQ